METEIKRTSKDLDKIAQGKLEYMIKKQGMTTDEIAYVSCKMQVANFPKDDLGFPIMEMALEMQRKNIDD